MIGTLVLWAIAGILAVILLVRAPHRAKDAARLTLKQAPLILVIVTLAIVGAGFIAEIIPTALVASAVGHETGFAGIVVAALVGCVLPGGPMIAFPIVITLARAGAGEAQMVAMISAWAVIAVHRLIAWEVPLLGLPFAIRRILVSAAFPVLIGVTAAGLLAIPL